jgi:hydrophobic/amphiphilic exporter-1 (mainly G- bacteria), HAE1 family
MTLAQRVVKRPVLITVVYALIVIVALYSLSSIPLELMPSVSPPYVMVNTTYTGAGPETVEKTVTKIIESGISSVQGVKTMTSTSSEGSSRIVLEFNYGKDLDKAANDTRDKIDAVRDYLPDDCDTPSIYKLDPNSQPILKVALRGNRSTEELKKIAEDTVETKFEGTEGVSSVSVNGGREEAVRVDISQNRLAAYGLTITSIASALSTQNLELGAGTLTEGSTEYSIRTTGAFSTIDEDIANAQIATKDGVPILLKDVATVFDGYKDVETSVYVNGTPGVYLSVLKQSGKNTVSVVNSLYKSIKQLNTMLPSDVKLEIINDTSIQIRSTISDLVQAIIEGAILTLFFVLFFLRNIKSTIIIGLSLPIAVLITLLAMYFAGFTLNMMTMAGLLVSIGTLVDASIVVIDSITVYRERGTKPFVAATIGTQEVMVAVTAGVLTTAGAFLPILLFINQLGMMGLMFKDMVFTIIISSLVSLFVAITLVPVLASHYLPITTRKEKPLRNPTLAKVDAAIGNGIDSVNRGYRKLLNTCIHHRGATVGIVLALVLGSIVVFLPRLTLVFSPPMADNSVTLDISMPLGTRFEDTQDVVNVFADIAQKELKGVENIIATTGSSGGFSSSSTSYSGSLTVNLPQDSSKRVDSFAAIKTKLRAHFTDYPKATFSFEEGHRMSSRSDIDVTLTSTNYTGLDKTAEEILALIKAEVPEVTEPETDTETGLPQIEVKIDRERAASFGISVKAIATEIRDAIKGYQATVYRKGGNEYDVWVRLQPADRTKAVDLNKIFVLSSDGDKIPLSSLAAIDKSVGPVKIHRTNQNRTVDITGNLAAGQQANKVEEKIKQLIKTKLTVPSDVYITYTGSWSELSGQSQNIIAIICLALLFVFGIMAAQYESIKDPFINLTTIPIMIIGVLAAYFFMGQNLSMFTMIGIIMLIGIVVNNGILLVDATNLERARGVKLMEACINGGASRFRPVIITAGSTIIGEIPMAFFASDNSAITQPIGLAVLGGMITATFITLVIVPVVYYIVNKGDARRKGTL